MGGAEAGRGAAAAGGAVLAGGSAGGGGRRGGGRLSVRCTPASAPRSARPPPPPRSAGGGELTAEGPRTCCRSAASLETLGSVLPTGDLASLVRLTGDRFSTCGLVRLRVSVSGTGLVGARASWLAGGTRAACSNIAFFCS